MPIFRFLGKNSRFWESLTKKKKIKGHFQGKTWIFQEFFVRFGNVDENPRFGPKNVDGLFFLVATLVSTVAGINVRVKHVQLPRKNVRQSSETAERVCYPSIIPSHVVR